MMREPLDSIDPFDWNVFGDFLSDRDDPVGEARARRIAQALASGRTGLWLEYETGRVRKLSKLHFSHPTGGLGPAFVSTYRWLASCPPDQKSDLREISPALYPEHFATRPGVARLFFDKLCDLGPFLWLPEGDTTVSVPAGVAVCPECGGELLGTVEAWATETGEPEEVTLDCVREPDWNDEEWEHHYWHQSDWQSTHDAVERWARDTVRVRTREVGLQSTDNPQSTEVKDGPQPAHKKKPGR